MSLYPAPEIIEAEIWSSLPERYRVKATEPEWARANRPGTELDSFLEGPAFDRDGNLWVTDIPYGRIFRISPEGDWTLVAEYDGWPNGMKLHRDGTPWIADYRKGILRLDPGKGTVETVLDHRYTEHFRGCNDLHFDREGRLYFTDQGQSGLQMQNGRVYRYDPSADRLDLLLDTGVSPNGLVLNENEEILYVGMTRANAIWRLPLMPDGGVSKVGLFIQLSGGLAGPDGMALGADGSVWVVHCGNGCVWGFDRLGHPKWRVVAPQGLMTTNIAFGGADGSDLYITQADTGLILKARVPPAGKPMFSHK